MVNSCFVQGNLPSTTSKEESVPLFLTEAWCRSEVHSNSLWYFLRKSCLTRTSLDSCQACRHNDSCSLLTSSCGAAPAGSIYSIGSSRDSYTRRAITSANHYLCGRSGATRIVDWLRESTTLDRSALHELMEEGTDTYDILLMLESIFLPHHWVWNWWHVNGELRNCPGGKQMHVRMTKLTVDVF